MRPVIALLLALICVLPVQTTAHEVTTSAYDEVPQDHWAYAAMDYMANIGVLEGYPDDFFDSERILTRYEFAQAIARALDMLAHHEYYYGKMHGFPIHVYVMTEDLRREFEDQITDVYRVLSDPINLDSNAP